MHVIQGRARLCARLLIPSFPAAILSFGCAVLSLGGAVLTSGCAKSRPDFGTLPVVEVPLEKTPPKDARVEAAAKEREQAKAPAPQPNRDLPDPSPLITKYQFEYALKFNKGELSVLSHRPVTLTQPSPSARRMGRFAFELWSGDALIERVRFDFPLLAAGGAQGEDVIESGLVAQTQIRVPATDRATRARILDRKTRKMLAVTWPPEKAAEVP